MHTPILTMPHATALLLTALLPLPVLLRSDSGERERPPNIVFLLTDDQGWQDLGCNGHPFLATPNFDRIARGGTRFDSFYVNASVCSPSRTAFMTGQYPARHQVHGHFSSADNNARRDMPNWLNPEVATVSSLLQDNGYRTGHFGKWHLGHGEGAPEPGQYGFDSYRTLLGTGPGWDRNGETTERDLAHVTSGQATDQDRFWTHSTDLIMDQALAFIAENRDEPFYLNIWTSLPHAPNRPTAQQLEPYAGLEPSPQAFDSWMRAYAADAKDFDQQLKTYCAAMSSVDSAVGRLLETLDELGLSEDTLLFYTSDNGPEDYHISNMRNSGLGATGQLRGRKRSLYEGGIRMPCIAYWPGRIPAGRVDETSVLAAVDWLPTVCSLAGLGEADIELDGEDVSSTLLGAPRERAGTLFWEWRARIFGNPDYKSPSLALRAGKWKLLAEPDRSRIELYDLTQDAGERENLAREHPQTVDRLFGDLLDWKDSLPD